ncbi:Hypothetical predicted protein [Paramuricea clavata]|uniref:Uncharacterized protein n=1 Tax=Paramuricea clavata TaxID=317549 RepID=A0A6S7HB75_PARCT|nr:Hypothetical predicted protein [Paramuricea clavata]
MENQLYDRDKVLQFVLADSGDENSDSEDELVADVQDEFGQEMTLPDMRTNPELSDQCDHDIDNEGDSDELSRPLQTMSLDQVQKDEVRCPNQRKKGKKDQLPWKQFTGIEDNTGSSVPFVEVPGPSRRALQALTILDILQLLIPITLVQSWVDETNRYAAVLRTRKPSNMKWVDVSVEELFAYIGMVIAMGLANLPSVLDYFATEPILSHPWFPLILSQDRFVLISRYFHVSDDTQFPGDKLGKLRALIDHLVQSFQNHWTPHREISIDEQMIGAKKASKVWCEELGTGRLNFPLCVQFSNLLIMDLVKPYLNKDHRLFMDNFYSMPTLYEQLYEKKTLACGTVRQESQDRKGKECQQNY